MKIKSNIAQVIGRLESFQRNAPKAVQQAMNPDRYRSALADLARVAMTAVADTDEERAAIPVIVNTLAGGRTPMGMIFSMNALPVESTTNLVDFMSEIPRQEIIDWVAEHKEITDRDHYKTTGNRMSDETIASRVAAAIQADPEPWVATDQPGHGALNPEGLAYVAGLVNLDASKVEPMLLAALRIWVEYMRATLPSVVGYRILHTLK